MSAKPKRRDVPPAGDFWGPPKTAEQRRAEFRGQPLTQADLDEMKEHGDEFFPDIDEFLNWLRELRRGGKSPE